MAGAEFRAVVVEKELVRVVLRKVLVAEGIIKGRGTPPNFAVRTNGEAPPF